MECRLTASVSGDPAPLHALISHVEGPGLVDWPDIDPRAGVEATIGLLLRPSNHGGATSFEQARRVANAVHERLADRIERDRRAVELGRVVPFDLQAIRPIPRAVLVGGYESGGRAWMLDNWGVERPLAHVDLHVQTRIESEPRGRGRPRAGSTAPRAWTSTTATWTFVADAFPWPVFRVLLKRWPGIAFRVEFEDADGLLDRTWSPVEIAQARHAA